MYLHSSLVLIMVVAISCAWATDIPLCGSSHGFAGDINSEFTLVPNVEVDRQKGEALIIAVRPIPYNPNAPTAVAQAIIDASYTIGNETFRLASDGDGLLTIADRLPKGTTVHIAIRNARIDGLSPFVMYTYVANKPHCYLNIAPRSAFLGPVPGNAAGRPASLFFTSAPPTGVSGGGKAAFRFGVIDGTPVTVWYASSDSEVKAGHMRQMDLSAEVVWTAQTPVYIEVRPIFEGPRTMMMRAVIEWRLVEGPEGEANYDGNEDEEDGGPVPKGNMPAPQGTPVGAKMASMSLLTWMLVSVGAYFVVRSVYNYRVGNIQTFPEYVPHHEVFGSVFTAVKETASAFKNRAKRARGGYSGVNAADEDI
eukprot:GILI01017933.1.p1 GENE.GILI01017933.1~~GILI01017933.1.p1  ORF type:complete len:366 (+),score=45.95 GILI01017933.1:35-1132(+)